MLFRSEVTSKDGKKSMFNIPHYKFLLDAPFRISHKCCDVMKKKPAKQYEKETGRKPIIATLAEEKYDSEGMWIPTNEGLGYSKILDYLKENGIEIPY